MRGYTLERGAVNTSQRPVPGHRCEPDPNARPHIVEPWPRGISRRASMRISDVLGRSGRSSRPSRTPSCASSRSRAWSSRYAPPPATASTARPTSERLRFVLRQQRDHYLPLKVIAGQLSMLDAGDESETPALTAVHDGSRQAPAIAGRWIASALAADCGVTEKFIAELVEAGMLRRARAGTSARGRARSSCSRPRWTSTGSTRATCGHSAPRPSGRWIWSIRSSPPGVASTRPRPGPTPGRWRRRSASCAASCTPRWYEPGWLNWRPDPSGKPKWS